MLFLLEKITYIAIKNHRFLHNNFNDFALINVKSLSDEFFVKFLIIQRQTHEYCESLNFDEICKSRSVTWTVYVNTWKK